MKIINFSPTQREELKNIVSRFETFLKFSKNKKSAYRYAEVFKISICPYCNIHYIDTISDITRPEFDHFIPKSSKEGKGKELDIDNLVPSCHVCNAIIKRNKLFQISTHIHPFYDDFDSIIRFCIDIKDASYLVGDNFDIVFYGKDTSTYLQNKAFNSINDLRLRERYQVHKNYVIEILKFIKHYNACHRKQIYDIMGINNIEFYTLENLINGFMGSDINRTSLGKLRSDILATYLE